MDFQKRLVPIFKGDLDAMFDHLMWHGMLIFNAMNKKMDSIDPIDQNGDVMGFNQQKLGFLAISSGDIMG